MTDNTSDTTAADGRANRYFSIGEVLATLQNEFPDVSISKIRFLESRGLVTPERAPSGYRKFVDADVDRLRWILTMQRDHFLPLRVIKERLDSGDVAPSEADPGEDSTAAAPAVSEAPAAGARRSRFRSMPPADDLSVEDFSRLSSLSAAQINELIKFGIIEPRETDDGARFNRAALQVAKASAKFLDRGVEARHLKAWRVAAEREAGLIEQIVTPLIHTNAGGRQAADAADEMIDMGNTIREAIIVRTLRSSLRFDEGD